MVFDQSERAQGPISILNCSMSFPSSLASLVEFLEIVVTKASRIIKTNENRRTH